MANKTSGRSSGNSNRHWGLGVLVEHLETRCLLSATVLSQIPTQSVQPSSTATVNLETYFDDAAIPAGDTVVDIQTNLASTTPSDIPVELTTNATPNTVANFLQYITTGEYAKTIIHRSMPGFVIQGGGYDTNGNPITVLGNISGESATATLKNTTGTIAMALTAGVNSANSGTDNWFINLGNNSSLDSASDPGQSDNQGPFTAFGQVIYNGMTTVNAIAALQVVNANGNNTNAPFGNLPVQNFSGGNITPDNLVQTTPVVVPGGVNFAAVSGNSSLVTTSISNGNLTLTPVVGATGTTTVTITATDLGGGNASSTFTVNVPATFATASIAGTIYADTNHSGVWQAGDPGLNDVMVYIDANNNGQLDAHEISVNTDASGNYLLSNLAAGNYTVREVAPGGYVQTSPAAQGYLDVTLSNAQALTGQTFLDAPTGNATAEAVYRLYSPVTLEHLYTTDPREYNTLESYVGTWNGEGYVYSEYSATGTVGGITDEPLYRLYNPSVLQHLWTTDLNEYTVLATEGWEQENIVGYVFPAAPGSTATSLPTVPGSQALYRLMAPQVHLWTTALTEYDTLATEGWTQEGIIGYVL